MLVVWQNFLPTEQLEHRNPVESLWKPSALLEELKEELLLRLVL